MVKEIILNDHLIKISSYQEEKIDNLHKISDVFNVTSEEYHDVTTLLYEGIFDVKVPDKGLTFRGIIQLYSTSITNLYEKDQVGEYKLSLLEVST